MCVKNTQPFFSTLPDPVFGPFVAESSGRICSDHRPTPRGSRPDPTALPARFLHRLPADAFTTPPARKGCIPPGTWFPIASRPPMASWPPASNPLLLVQVLRGFLWRSHATTDWGGGGYSPSGLPSKLDLPCPVDLVMYSFCLHKKSASNFRTRNFSACLLWVVGCAIRSSRIWSPQDIIFFPHPFSPQPNFIP